MIQKSLLLSIIVSMMVAGCATDDPDRRAKTGAAIGAIAGAVLGHQIKGKKGRFIGAAVGAITGAAVGNYMDKQQKEFEDALAEEQRRDELQIQRMNDDSLKINISNEVSFDFDSASLKPAFTPSLNKVANLLSRYEKTVIHVVGYTDSVGREDYNQRLSEKRAGSVAGFFTSHGVPQSRIVALGRGETQPRASNATENGRAQNRRVELIIKAIVEGQEEKAYETPSSTAG